jgi:toxin ParE1/3/4
MKVFWTDKAVEQLAALHAYVSQVSPQYADRLVDRITRRTQQIESFPASGRTVPEMQLE